MPDKVCSKCGFPKPPTTDYFYKEVRNRDGLRGDCRACCDLATYLRRRNKRLSRNPAHMTPRALTGTPEYIAYRRRKGMLYQRIAQARKTGRLDRIPRLQAWLAQTKTQWYQSVRGA